MDKYIGRLLDNRYEILEVIGTGGMAVVYKARCHRLNRLVAIKILKDDFLEDEDFRRRFHAESQAVAMLSHPNIVSVYDVSTSLSTEADYIVMELIEGISLKQYMEKKGVLNWKETLHFAMQIAKALEHAHSRGVVHRDIKPHNVMVLKNGSVKVADFGIARMMSKGDTLTKEALGSVHYISPEQAKGGRVDNRSDIYSLGVVMYEMMSGRPPYEGESPVAVAIQHINGGAVMPSTLNPNIPGGMEQIIMKAMAKDIADRYTTATNMLADMDEFRKNPALLFDYNTPPLDAVTKLNKPPLTVTGPTPKTAAEQVEEKAQAHRERRQKPVAPPPPRKKQDRADDGGSRVATVAIIVCSVVAVVAISIFLIVLFNGGTSGSDKEKVEVPNLIGKYYDALTQANHPGLTVKQDGDGMYHEDFEEGQIVHQVPAYGEWVEEGTEIVVTVSLGKSEPVYMPNLVNMTKEQVQTIIDNLKLGINIIWKENYDDTVAAGNVISADPAEGVLLTSGQEITVTVSQGKLLKVTKLVGLELDMAIRILQDQGFPIPEYEYVFNEEERGVVVYQSVDPGTEVPSSTVIKLGVSQGPEETTEPETTEPETTVPETTEPETTIPTVTKTVTIDLAAFIPDADTLVQISRNGVEIYNQYHSLEDTVVTLENQTGSGIVEYYVFINQGENAVHVEKVTFTTDE